MGDSYREELKKNKKGKRQRASADRQTASGTDPDRTERAQREALRREYFKKSLLVRKEIQKAQKRQQGRLI